MILREIEVTELGESIRNIIREEIAFMASPKDETLVRRKEAREILGGISNPTVISYEKRGLLHPVRIGGTILYKKSDLINFKK